MHTNDLFKVRIYNAILGLLENFALDIEVTPKRSTLESFAEAFVNDGFKFPDVRDGLAEERKAIQENYNRTGEKPKLLPKYEALKKAVELQIAVIARKEKELEREKQSNQDELLLDRALRTYDRAIEKFGFDEVQEYFLEYLKIILPPVSSDNPDAAGMRISMDVSSVEALRNSVSKLKSSMLELFDAKGDMDLALMNAKNKFDEDESA